jgi:hypothetical protein
MKKLNLCASLGLRVLVAIYVFIATKTQRL